MKTIKEKTRQFAKEKVGKYDYLGNEYEAYLDGVQDATDYIMSLPLCDRLTSEEKEKIKELYDFALLRSAYATLMMRDIFGTAMFEKGGNNGL